MQVTYMLNTSLNISPKLENKDLCMESLTESLVYGK